LSPSPRSTPCWEAWTGDEHRRQPQLRRCPHRTPRPTRTMSWQPCGQTPS
jgi:hypothetical protein